MSLIKRHPTYPDHLMTTRLGMDETGTVVWRWEGEAFGESQAEHYPDGDGREVVMRLRFPGQYFDSESNLHYNHHRYYSPELGRYITSDPIGLGEGINTYGYVEQNPLKYIDPMGLVRPYDETYIGTPENCSHYTPGGTLSKICQNKYLDFDDPWGNCSRKCVKDYYPGRYGGPWYEHLFWYFPKHPACWWECVDDDEDQCLTE